MLILNQSETVFLDTNILIHQSFEDLDTTKHIRVLKTLDEFIDRNYSIHVSSQVLREFFAISTNSKIFQTPLSIENAIKKLNEFQNNFTVLYDNLNTRDFEVFQEIKQKLFIV